MSDNIFFSIVSLFYSIMLLIIYFSKKRLVTEENNIYKKLIIINFFGLIIEIFPATLAIRMLKEINLNIAVFILKFILYYFIIWLLEFTYYIFTICMKDRLNNNDEYLKKTKLMHKIIILIMIVSIFLVTILPLYIKGVNYTYGPSANLVYLLSGALILFWIYLLIRNYKYIKSKKYTPVFSFIALGLITMIVQYFNPELTLMIPMETFVTFLMYFTIENPDIKMLNELYKNKEIMEQNYEDKYNFLFEITQESRNPLKNIETVYAEIKDEKDINKIKAGMVAINNMAQQLDFSINNIMNVSSLDAQKLNIIEKKYNIVKLCSDLTTKLKLENKKNIEFKYTYPKEDLILYGDDMKLKHILYSLLNNSIEKTNEGFVEFKVNLIEKYDICRIIFTINDSGPGMTIDKINEILSSTGSLDKNALENLQKKEYNVNLCPNVITLMGGNLMIKSDIGVGTEFQLVIDQRVYHDKDSSILSQYENIINDYKKVLIVSQDKKLITKLKSALTRKNITYSVLYYGQDAVDKIKFGKKYDYILISDEMAEMSGLVTLNKMKEIDNFNIPVIVILDSNKENIKKHYIEDGFNDYILLSDINNEIKRIIEKY